MDEVIAAWNTRAEQSLRPTAPDAVRERVRHKVRGTEYAVIGIAEVQTNHAIHEGVSLVVYQGDNGKLWCRPKPEFYDGRFEPLTKELSDADVAVDEATVERVRDAIRDHMNAHGPICTDNLAKAALAAMGAKP